MPSLVISLLSSRISLQNREKRRFEPTFKKVRPARLSGRKILISSGFQRGQGLQKRPQNGHPRHSCIKDSKFLEAPAVSSAENVRRTGLCAGSDFTISYRSCVFFLHSSGAGITLEVYGELSERSKVRHSKCRVPKRNLGFESLTLRQKPSHIKAFAHMTGLFFSLKVTSAYMIFGKNSGMPAGLPCVRQSQDIVHYICRGDLGLVIQMAVNIRRRANIAVTQPLLDLLQRHIVRQKQ